MKKTKDDGAAIEAETKKVLPATETGGAMDAKTATASKPAKRCNPSLSVEMSRRRIQARTGLVGLGQGKAFNFDNYGGQDGAYKAAEAWLKTTNGSLA